MVSRHFASWFDHLYAPIVIDNGSGTIKADFALEKVPRHVFPTVYGRARRQRGAPGQRGGWFVEAGLDWFVGHKAQCQRSILALSNPIQRGVVTNWDDMEKVKVCRQTTGTSVVVGEMITAV